MKISITELPDGRFGIRHEDGTHFYVSPTELLTFSSRAEAEAYIAPPVAANAILRASSTGKEPTHGN